MNETTITLSLSFLKSGIMSQAEGMAVANYLESVSGTSFIRSSVLISSNGPTVVPYGQVTVPGRCVFHNTDSNNNISLFDGSGGTAYQLLLPSSWHCLYLAPGVVLYGQAVTASVQLDYLLISQ